MEDERAGGDATGASIRQLAALAADQGPDIQIVADRSGVIHYASSAAESILGIDPRTHRNAHVLHFVHSEDVESAVAVLEGLCSGVGRHRPVRVRLRGRDDEWVECEVAMASTESADGGWLVISVREVAARNQLAGRQATLERLVQTASVEFARTRWFDVDEVTEHLLRSLCGIFGARLIEIGWSESEGDPLTVGARWAARSEDGWSPAGVGVRGALFESMRPAGTGSEPIVSLFEDLAAVSTTAAKQFREAGLDAAVELRMSSSRPRAVLRLGFDGGLHRWDNVNAEPVVLLGRLVLSTLRRCRAEEELHERARRDSLTGLFNRDEFYRMLEGAVSGARPGSRVGVLYCDVDGFKSTNDQHGHASGDEVLRTVASVLQRSVRDGDVVARVGGDEFAALCRGLESPMQLEAVAERLISRIAGARVSGRPVRLSVGSAMLGDDQDADALLSAADEAMYRAKRVRRKASGTDWSST